MLKLSQTSRICIKSLVQIKSKSLNKTISRTKREIFSRRPVKVVTEEGKDFYQQKDYRQPISSADKEIKSKFLSQNERQKYNQYYDEGFDEENLDFQDDMPSYYENTYKKSKILTKTVESNENSKQKFDERVGKRQTNEFKEKRDKTTEKGPKPKVPGIPVYQKIGDKNSEFV